MIRSILTTIALMLGLVGLASAQQSPVPPGSPGWTSGECDCPGNAQVGNLDYVIAVYRAKLDDLAAGRRETGSQLPNDPATLRTLIAESQAARITLSAQIASCRTTCRLYPALPENQPLSAFTGLRQACPECFEAEQRLDAAEIALAEAINERVRFSDRNQLSERREQTGAGYQAQLNALARARIAAAESEAGWQALDAEARRLEGLVNSRDYFRTWTDSAGNISLIDFVAFQGAEVVDFLGALTDAANQQVWPGGPIIDNLALSRGNAARQARRAERAFRSQRDFDNTHYRNLRAALPDMDGYIDGAAGYDDVPGYGPARNVVERLELYERDIRRLSGERDAAARALVQCNLLRCLPTGDASGLFGPGGLHDLPPPLAPAPLAASDEPDGAGLPDEAPAFPVAPDPAAGSPVINLSPTGPDGTGLADWTPPPPPLAPGVQAALDRAAAAGVQPTAGACDVEPELVCRRIGEAAREACVARLSARVEQCRSLQASAFLAQGPVGTCRESCRFSAASTNDQFWLRTQILATIDREAAVTIAASEGEKAALRARIDANLTEVAAIEAAVEARQTYLYFNAEMRTIIEATEEIDPQPPLEFAGLIAARPSAQEWRRIHDLELENTTFATRLENWADPELDAWQRDARQSWLGGGRWPAPIACEAEAVSALEMACVAACTDDGEAAGLRSICQPASLIGRLSAPGSTHQIYPPGDPRRED